MRPNASVYKRYMKLDSVTLFIFSAYVFLSELQEGESISTKERML